MSNKEIDEKVRACLQNLIFHMASISRLPGDEEAFDDLCDATSRGLRDIRDKWQLLIAENDRLQKIQGEQEASK